MLENVFYRKIIIKIVLLNWINIDNECNMIINNIKIYNIVFRVYKCFSVFVVF